jgi:DNA-binding transcriptional MerR regulator
MTMFPWEDPAGEPAAEAAPAGQRANGEDGGAGSAGDDGAARTAAVPSADRPGANPGNGELALMDDGSAGGSILPAGGEAVRGAGETEPEAAGAPPEALREVPASRRPEAGSRPVARKEYYSISEVSDLVGLPAHVLRYWESQFAVLSPSKNRSGNRVYQRKEIKLILLVKKLLHEDKYTVEGAKQKLEQLRRGGGMADAAGQALNEQMLAGLREELQALEALLQVEPS